MLCGLDEFVKSQVQIEADFRKMWKMTFLI